MRCDVIAEGVVSAVKEVGLKVPLVVRLEGTNVNVGKEIITTSDVNVIAADNLGDAAQKIVKAVMAAFEDAILVDENTRVICQGITEARELFIQSKPSNMVLKWLVASPQEKEEVLTWDYLYLDTVQDAYEKTKANATAIYVPPPFAADAILEAIDTGIELIVCITEGIPVADMIKQKSP